MIIAIVAWLCRNLLQRPWFDHDCRRCIYLGHYTALDIGSTDPRVMTFELYYCNQLRGPYGMTVLARFSDDGPDYISGMGLGYKMWLSPKGVDDKHPLAEAYRRARARKLDLGKYQECHEHGFLNGVECPRCLDTYYRHLMIVEGTG